MPLGRDLLSTEIQYRTSRSSGSGGQHVNKVESRVEAVLNIPNSVNLTEKQRQTISNKLKNRLDSSGNLSVSSSTSRSQAQNKKLATDRLFSLLETALKKEKPRKKTTIPQAVKAKRLDDKKYRSKLKSNRSFKPDN